MMDLTVPEDDDEDFNDFDEIDDFDIEFEDD